MKIDENTIKVMNQNVETLRIVSGGGAVGSSI